MPCCLGAVPFEGGLPAVAPQSDELALKGYDPLAVVITPPEDRHRFEKESLFLMTETWFAQFSNPQKMKTESLQA